MRRGSVVLRFDPGMLDAQYASGARAGCCRPRERAGRTENGNVASRRRARPRAKRAGRRAVSPEPPRKPDRKLQPPPRAVREPKPRSRWRMPISRARSTWKRPATSPARPWTSPLAFRAGPSASRTGASATTRIQPKRRSSPPNSPGRPKRTRWRSPQTTRRSVNGTAHRRDRSRQARNSRPRNPPPNTLANGSTRRPSISLPPSGVVASFNLHPGDLLRPNQQAAIIDTFADPYAYVYASQRDLGTLASSTRVKVVSDAGGRIYAGVVETFDRTAQFTPQNVETADQRADLVYGVKVRIHDPLAPVALTARPSRFSSRERRCDRSRPDLTKRYGERTVVDDLSLSVHGGQHLRLSRSQR